MHLIILYYRDRGRLRIHPFFVLPITSFPSKWIPIQLSVSYIIVQMQTQQLQRYELVESFLASIRSAQSKQEFLTRVQEFDIRFTEEQPTHAFSEKQKSTEKLPPMPQEKPKNPFKTNLDENFRQHSFIQPGMATQYLPFPQPQPPVRGNYSRTEQNFYKNQPGKNDSYGALNNNFGYGAPNGQNYPTAQGYGSGQGGYGGMGMLNYNPYNQKEYDDLKQEFFRAPPSRQDPYTRLQENYRQGEGANNLIQMGLALGVSSSTELLRQSNRPSARVYTEKANPFMRQ